jgi:hypothetical protein
VDLAPAADPAPPAGANIVDVAPPAEPEAPVLAVRAPAPAHTLPQQQAAGRIAAHEVRRDPDRVAAQAAPARPGPRASPTEPKAHAGPAAARTRRQVAAKAPAAASAVDTDVALISAIIQHANAREEAQEGCADKGCGARKP